jgi:hypothetical protein
VEYKPEYMADYYAEQEPHEFVVVQERTILVQYTVEASSLSNAIAQIEEGDYTGVIDEDASHALTDKIGRIVSARVNDDDD